MFWFCWGLDICLESPAAWPLDFLGVGFSNGSGAFVLDVISYTLPASVCYVPDSRLIFCKFCCFYKPRVPRYCFDTPGFVDAQGYVCESNYGFDCTDTNIFEDYWGFSSEELQNIQANCPYSCQFCM